MELTEQQRRHIDSYLAKVADFLGDVREETRKDALARLRRRITRELRQTTVGAPTDEDVAAVLSACGSPPQQAAALLGREAPRSDTYLSPRNQVWLGVCAALAEYLRVSPRLVRGVMVAFGLVASPVVLTLYLAAYFVLYFSAPRTKDVPKIRPWPVAKTVTVMFLILLALHEGVYVVLWGITIGYARLAQEPLVLEMRWRWIETYRSEYFFFALATILPLAMLSALPVTKGWDATLRKMAQAGVALYALVLCYGMGRFLTGLVIKVSDHFAGFSLGDLF